MTVNKSKQFTAIAAGLANARRCLSRYAAKSSWIRGKELENKEDYHAQMMLTLEKCQFIEETLKMCILSAIRISEKILSPYFPFNYQESAISKLPLGSLIKKFSKINNDKVLLNDLRDFTTERNVVAHQSLLHYIGELEDEGFMSTETEKMSAILGKATSIHHRLLDIRRDFAKSENKLSREKSNA